jgi:signal transduction histidine kinase
LGTNPKELQFFELSKDKEDFYALIATIRWIIYSGMFISIGIVIIVGFVLARSISEPILKLNESALNIADGNTYKAVDVKRNDEIGTLANSINKMAAHLSEDNERLAALNLRQRQFFGDITHEVRNPLQALLTGFDMLELDLPAEKKAMTMEMARAQVSRIRQLFDDLGTLARLDEDPNFIQKEEVDLVPILKNLTGIYSPLAKEKGLSIQLTAPENIAVIADKRKIEQVMDNLISNAVKYTQSGYIEIEVTEVEAVNKDRKGVQVAVSDTGLGIDMHHLSHLFERFYRTDKARSRDLGGTGLGLSIVKSILELHQSTINVESEVGKGSRFWFVL